MSEYCCKCLLETESNNSNNILMFGTVNDVTFA